MARYVTTVESRLPREKAFAYIADFSNSQAWDPGVREARRIDAGALRVGSAFDLVARFAGRDVPLHYEIVAYEPPRRVVLEARRPGFTSRDEIHVEDAGARSVLHYDARLTFDGIGRFAEPVLQRIFLRIGDRAAAGLREALNP